MKKSHLIAITLFFIGVLQINPATSQSWLWSLSDLKRNFNAVPPNDITPLPIGDEAQFLADYPFIVSNLQDALPFVYKGAKPQFSQNIIYDMNGRIKFFVVDGNVYDHEGVLLANSALNQVSYLGSSYSLPEGETETIIVPVPEMCNVYYVISASRLDQIGFSNNIATRTPAPAYKIYYTIIDFNQDHLYLTDRKGLVLGTQEIVSLDNDECNAVMLALSQPINSNEERFLYIQKCRRVYKCRVTNTGIQYEFLSEIIYINALNAGYTNAGFYIARAEFELAQRNNKYVVASVQEIDPNYIPGITVFDPKQVIEIREFNEADGEGNFPTSDTRRLFYLVFPGNFNVTGIEFSPSENRIFVMTKEAPYLWYADIDENSVPPGFPYNGEIIDPNSGQLVPGPNGFLFTQLPITVDASYEGSQLERGLDGKIYFYRGKDELGVINDPDGNPTVGIFNPGSTYNHPASIGETYGIPPNTLTYSCHLLQDQVDGEDYLQNMVPIEDNGNCCSEILVYDFYEDYIIPATTTQNWNASFPIGNTTIYFDKNLVVESGATLNITNLTLRFSPDSKLIIEPGGTVNANGSTFTSVECIDAMWLGAEVRGNNGQNQTLNPGGAQGKFILNNCEISNAIDGATVAERISGNIYNLTKTGGILRAFDSRFRNNKRDVDFQTYIAPNGNNQLSLFKNCTFETNSLLKDQSFPGHHVNLVRTKGIYFTACVFINSDLNTYQFPYTRGTGIRSYDSYFVVQEGCTAAVTYPNPCPTVNQVPTSFSNLTYGINAFSLNPINTAMIKNSNFNNCNRSIFMRGIDNATIHNNNFNVGSDFFIPFLGTVRSYGVYLDNCSAYNFTENDFTSSFNGYYGAYVNNSGTDANRIYHNTVTSLKEGMVAAAINDGTSANAGLDYQCNIFNNDATVDIGVVLGGVAPFTLNLGISDLQGVCQTSAGNPVISSPANNIFTDPSPSIPNTNGISGDLWQNTGVNTIKYNFSSSPALKTEPVNYNLIGNTQLNDCVGSNAFPIINNINDVCPGVNIFKPRPIIYANIDVVKSVIVNNAALIDGGNTQARIDYINSTNINWQIRDELMNYAPYLSDEVLITLINKTPAVAPWVIDEVASACSPLSDDVLLELVNRTPQVPDYILRDQFVAAKPVRKDVMIALINKNVPQWVLREVCMANSPLTDDELLALLQRQQPLNASTVNDIFMLNTPLTSQVQLALDNRNPKIPNWVKTNLANSSYVAPHPNTRQDLLSPVEELEAENAFLGKEVALDYQELIRQYLNDTTVNDPLDSVLYIYKIAGLPHGKCKQVKTMLAKGDYAGAEALNDTIRSYNNPDLDAFCTMTDMILKIYTDTSGCYKLLNDHLLRQDFEDRANQPLTCKECAQAQAIIEIVFGTKFAEGFDDLVPENAPRSANAVENIDTGENNPESSLNVKLYPNPNNGIFTVGYFPENDLAVTSLKVYDMTGKLVYSQQVNIRAGGTRELRLEIPAGIYFTELMDEAGTKQVIKISVTK
ncbi:MAG: T9SS type A sorting domain-containing protein [Bacteroidota bacterium]